MGGFFGNIGSAIKHFVSNPIQPITHALGEAGGVTANLKNGVHIDPVKLLTTAEAIGGNPYAMASVAGNLAGTVGDHTLLGNAGVGKIGNVVGKVGQIVAPMTGGLAGLKNIPGAGMIAKIPGISELEKIPGLSSVLGLGAPGGGGADSGAPGGSPGGADGGSAPGAMPAGGPAADGGNPYGDNVGNANMDYGSPSQSVMQRIEGYLGKGASAVGSAISGGAGGAGGSGGSGGGLNPLVLEGLAGADGLSSALASQRQGKLQDQALKTATDSYAARAPLRTAGVAGMQAAPVKLNLPSTGNPFSAPQTQGA
jgi:hypothetical protein